MLISNGVSSPSPVQFGARPRRQGQGGRIIADNYNPQGMGDYYRTGNPRISAVRRAEARRHGNRPHRQRAFYRSGEPARHPGFWSNLFACCFGGNRQSDRRRR
jgi:hypothetical protein